VYPSLPRQATKFLVICRVSYVTSGIAAMITVLAGCGSLMAGAGLAVYIMKGRLRQQAQREKDKQQESKQLRALMYALTSVSDKENAVQGSAGSITNRK
jgi:hypothetical protein